MDPLTFMILLAIGAVVGILGAMLGIGGGILIVPLLTLGLNMPIHTAIAASLISVIATSCATATMTTGQELVNIGLGMFLETSTTLGAIAGAFVSLFLPFNALAIVFIAVVLLSAYGMVRKTPSGTPVQGKGPAKATGPSPSRLDLSSTYYDAVQKATISYTPKNLKYGWGMSFFAGLISGIIGIGGGVIKVPAMNVLMKVPVKVAAATSNFMIGVTAVASAYVFFTRGMVDVVSTSALLLGVFPGSILGFRLAYRANRVYLRYIFAIVLGVVAVLMAVKVLGIGGS
jgi:hypothetical protein